MNVDTVRDKIKSKINSECRIKVNGLRNKTNIYYGVITSAYPYIFSVSVSDENKSFSYVDVITGEVEIEYL